MALPWLAGAIRFLLLGGFVLAMGDLALATLAHQPPGAACRRVSRALVAGLALMLLGTGLEFTALVWSMVDGDWSTLGDLLPSLFATPHSTGSLLGIRALFLVAVLAFAALTGRKRPHTVFLLGGIGLSILLSVDGHAGDQGLFSLVLASDVVHAFSAAVWLGGLSLLWLRLPKFEASAAFGYSDGFSSFATLCFPLAVASGVSNSWFRLGPDVWNRLHTPYGALLLAKTLVVLVVLAFAAYLRQVLLPTWSVGTEATLRFRRRIGWELLLGFAILALTAVLTQMSPVSA